MSDVYMWQLDGAMPVTWKPEVTLAARDTGGEEFDTVEYVSHCPKCDRTMDMWSHYNYCPSCGTKLWWSKKPEILVK